MKTSKANILNTGLLETAEEDKSVTVETNRNSELMEVKQKLADAYLEIKRKESEI